MVWDSISLTGKTSLLEKILMQRCGDEILQPVEVPYLHSLGPNCILKDANIRPTEWSLSEITSRIWL